MNGVKPSTKAALHKDIFGELAVSDDLLIWKSPVHWWDDANMSRWRRLGDLKHPAIVPVSSSQRRSDQLVVEFQRPSGTCLSVLLQQEEPSKNLVPPYSLALLVQITNALEVLHSLDIFGLTITPAAVYLQLDDTAPSFEIIPLLFPLSVDVLTSERFLQQESSDVLPYVAQERLRVQPGAPASDVYALGVLGAQAIFETQWPNYVDNAVLIRDLVAGWFQAQILPEGEERAARVIRQCLARRPGRRPSASEARVGLAAALRASLCEPCQVARQHRESGDLDAALQVLSTARNDPILGRNPQLHLLYAEIVSEREHVDPLVVIAAAKAAAERVERLLDEEQITDPVDRYFSAYLFATPADAQLTACKIYTLLGTVYREENLLQQALQQYDRALQTAGDDAELLLSYASMLRQADRPGEALSALERAEKIGVQDEHRLHLEKACAMERQGMLDQAIVAYTAALRITEDGNTWTQLGKLYLAQGSSERDKAIEAFQCALDLDQHEIEAATYLADLALEQNDEDAALAALNSVRVPPEVWARSPKTFDHFLRLAETLMGRLSARLAQNRTDPAVHRRLGDLFLLRAHLLDEPDDLAFYEQASGDYLRALLSYRNSLQLDANQPEVAEKIESIEEPLIQEQGELEREIKEGNVQPATYNRLALIDWRLSTLRQGQRIPTARQEAVALLKRAVEVLDRSIEQDLTQRDMRRLYGALAEQLRRLESGG